MIQPFAAFVAVSAVVIVTPGPDTALTIRNTLVGGRGNGIATALGVAVGQALWTTAASLGVTALLLASRPAFLAIKLAGAGYLAFLGLRSVIGALRGRGAHDAAATSPVTRPPRPAGLRQGVFSNLGNPKMAVFFTSLLPQFVPAGDPSFRALVGLGLCFCAMTLAWLSLYALVVARVGDLLAGSSVRRVLDAVTGAVLVALGVRLAAESR